MINFPEDAITFICVDNEGAEEELSINTIYAGKYFMEDGEWVRVFECDNMTTGVFDPSRFTRPLEGWNSK